MIREVFRSRNDTFIAESKGKHKSRNHRLNNIQISRRHFQTQADLYVKPVSLIIQFPNHPKHLDILPLLDSHHTLQRLPQEPFSRLELLLVKVKLVSPECR
jgi:hypothetical protein